MPRLVTKETYDGSGPVEAISGPDPVGPFRPALLGPDPKSVLRTSLLPQNGINCLQVGGFVFVDITHVCTISVIGPVDAGNMKTSLRLALLVVEDALDLPGGLDRFLRFGGGLFQDPCPDFVAESPQEHGVHHEQLHALNALAHGLVHLGLGSPHQVSLIGDGVIGLDFVGIDESV
jgi:hypothetical protein